MNDLWTTSILSLNYIHTLPLGAMTEVSKSKVQRYIAQICRLFLRTLTKGVKVYNHKVSLFLDLWGLALSLTWIR